MPRRRSATPTGPGSSTTGTAPSYGPRPRPRTSAGSRVRQTGRTCPGTPRPGNLNNALLSTEGEFLLILDADQVPLPDILDRTLGYFTDDRMALVQTPQWFTNVPPSDPLGSQAPLFYGPIQQGKDGWNAAFFCGSNAVIRRDALMQLGVSRYASEVEVGVHKALKTARAVLRRARRRLTADDDAVRRALDSIEHDIRRARRELRRGDALFDVTYRFQRRVEAVRRELVDADLTAVQADLAVIAELERGTEGSSESLATFDPAALEQMSLREWSPLGAVETVQALVDAVDVDLGAEAQPIMPLATISVTEDMATCMRLHGMGWRTAYHDEGWRTVSRRRTLPRCSPSGSGGRRAPSRSCSGRTRSRRAD